MNECRLWLRLLCVCAAPSRIGSEFPSQPSKIQLRGSSKAPCGGLMKVFSACLAESAAWGPRAVAAEENGAVLGGRRAFVARPGFRDGGVRGSRVAVPAAGSKERSGLKETQNVVARFFGAKRMTDAAGVPPKAEEENARDGEDEEEEDSGGGAEEIEKRLVSGERVLQISKADFTVSSLLDKIRRGRLDLRPSYQRDYVWDKRTASKLIESVLLNIPLPTMFFHEKSQGQLEVVDGKQRLTSIWCFMEDQKFPDGSDFALTGLEVLDELNGNKYMDLEESLREVMQDFALNVHTISRHSDAEVVFEVFERLNMGSTQLNEQELRNCVFQGRYNDLLEELALHPDMLRVFRLETPHKRMRDREFILRFFALRRSGMENFYLPAKNWLNNEMRRHQVLEEEDFLVMKFDFYRCLSLSVNVFGEQVFRLPRGQKYESDPNVCLWDTVMYGYKQLGSMNPGCFHLLHVLPMLQSDHLLTDFDVYRDDSRVLRKKKVLLLALNDLLIYDSEFKTNLLSTPKALKIRTKKWLLVLRELLGPS